MKVSVIGFGVMGRCAAKTLLGAGHTVVATDPAPGAEDAALDLGAGFSQTPDPSCDVALLFLPGPPVIRDLVPALLGASTITIVDHSTSDPQTARDMAALAEGAGGHWVDAPILGRPASVGQWALPCGATPGALSAVRPILDCYARAVFDLGAPGNGHMVKLLNQMMFGAINAMTAEMMAISERSGLPPAQLFDIITSSQAGTVSNLFKELGARISADTYENPTFSVQLLEKDIRLGLEMARDLGCAPLLGPVVDAMNKDAIAKGFGAADTAVMWKAFGDG